MQKQSVNFLMVLILGITAHLAFVNSVAAQTTIFNVPSTDVIAEKSIYLEADFISHPTSYRTGGFQTYGYRVVYGVKKNLEVGTNFFYTRNGSRTSPKEFQPNLKWKTYQNEKYGINVSTGAIFYVPLNKATGRRTYGLIYSNVSKVVKKTGGMRLTGGIYTLVGAKRQVGTKTGAIVGFEQPVARRLSFIADWYSGKNRFGYFTPGFSLAITKRQFLFAGYNFGNAGRGNNSLSVYYGATF